ncbi:recombinase family protein [Telmatospirillum sp. J64-1]|uniref:recombinase family protein n=1 Tax=Telmatospirillum sp. J64-1 TaxID=2502183 RepID=UPI00115DF4C3|nr:recombinase family protein [Telmatospirillum sp. J64-1]
MLIGYARVSTDEQNIDLQTDALEAAKAERIYSDVMSGATICRPGLQAMLDGLRDGDVVIVWKLDRLSRSLSELVKMAEGFADRGIQLRSLTEGFDTATALGRMVFGICGVLAEFERALIIERTKAGLDAARKQGRIIGRPAVVTNEVKQRALLLVSSGAVTSAGELRKALGLKKGTFHAAFPGGFAELVRQAARRA